MLLKMSRCDGDLVVGLRKKRERERAPVLDFVSKWQKETTATADANDLNLMLRTGYYTKMMMMLRQIQCYKQ